MTSIADPRTALSEALDAVRQHSTLRPDVAIILGTGLGALAHEIAVEAAIPYEAIPHFPVSTVESHTGQLLLGKLAGKPVVAMQGRFHRYEGYTLQQIALAVRVLHGLGAQTLLVSNACGVMNPAWRSGELMLIRDHINLLGDNPLVGPNVDEWGARFPDMSDPYDAQLCAIAQQVARDRNITLREGVFVAVMGPNLETAAEYRMLHWLGADVVGMSTVPEVITARHLDMRVLGISIMTDECFEGLLKPADVAEIIAIARQAEPKLTEIVKGVLQAI